MAGQPKASFYVVLVLVVGGLIAFAWYRRDVIAPPVQQVDGKGGGKIDEGQLKQPAEDPDSSSVTTVKEYSFRPAERLPPIKGGFGLSQAGGQHRPFCAERVGWLGTDHPGE